MRRGTTVLAAALAGILLFFGASGCGSDAAGENGQSNRQAGPAGMRGLGNRGQEEAIPVEAGLPFRADLASYVYGNANIEALREVEIIARVSGQLERLRVEEGDQVRSGQVLAELDKRELRLTLQENQARLENTRSLYERQKQMIEKELTSQEELDRAEFNYETALAQTERAELNLRYATITAPFEGVITRRLVDLGDMIRTNDVLFHLADTEKLLIRVYVPEKEMGRIEMGDRARIECEMLPGRYFGGEVEMIAPVVDPQTGTVKVTVRVEEGYDVLKPGMFCSVYILIETHENSMVISRRALIPETEVPEVFVIDDSMVVHRRQIEVGISQGDTLEVTGGLSPEEKVVLVGQESLNEGTPVRIVSGAGAEQQQPAGTPQRPQAPQAQSQRRGQGANRQ